MGRKQKNSATGKIPNKQSQLPKATSNKKQSGATTESRLYESIGREVWPAERQVLFKPERLRYVRKLIKPKGCVFCAAVKKGVLPESLLLYDNEFAIVVMNKYPYNTGHLLILPKRHCGEFLQLSSDEMNAINHCLKRSIEALTEVFQPDGFNVGMNLGASAGAGIPEHLHYHVVPRWNGDTNFFPLIADTKVVIETLESSFAKLLPYFPALPKRRQAK